MRRIVIVGCPGSGKTTLARRLARPLGLVHVEIDSVYHQAGWQPLPGDELLRRLEARLSEGAGWVADGNYVSLIGDWLHRRADTIVWLDLERPLVMCRVVGRTLRRLLTGQELWNGNQERWSNLCSWSPESNIIRWAWLHHPLYRQRYEARIRDGNWSHARVVRLTTRSQVKQFQMECENAIGLRHRREAAGGGESNV